MNPVDEFRSALASHGIPLIGEIRADGVLHRYKAEGDKDASAWYVLHGGDFYAGAYGCWRRQINEKWKQSATNGKLNDPKTLAEAQQKWRLAEAQRAREESERHGRMSKVAEGFHAQCGKVSRDHPYLLEKQVSAFGPVKESEDGDLVLPLCDSDGKVWSYQTIDQLGGKLFMPGGRVQGCFYNLCDRQDSPLIVCEGYATGATCYEATGWAVVCAMNCGNLLAVCRDLRKKYPSRTIIIAADDDRFTKDRNPGMEKAVEAAKDKLVNAVVARPEFPEDSLKGTDFNDLMACTHIGTVATILQAACPCPLSILSFDEIGVIPLSETDRLLGDHLLDKAGRLVIAGQGGSGKTRIVYQLIATCNGGDAKFLTFDIHPGARNAKWLVLQAENGVRRLQDERKHLMAMLGSRWPKFNSLVKVLTPLQEKDSFLALNNMETLTGLRKALEWWSPDIVVFDSLYDFAVDDLNKDKGMRDSLVAISQLARYRNPNRAIIILHHSLTGQAGHAKVSGADRASFARNSKVIFNWTRAQINIAPMSEDDNDQLAVACAKCSDGREFPQFAVKLNPDTMIYECDPDVDVKEWVKGVREGKKGSPIIPHSRVRELCDLAGSSKSDLAHSIMDDCGCARQSAYRYIKFAEENGCVKWSQEQDKYFKN